MSDHLQPLVVVTGAAAGIGAACARWFAVRSWCVVGVDVTAPGLPGDLAASHIGVTGSVTDEAMWMELAERVDSDGRPVRALVNNAAIQPERPLLESSVNEFVSVLDVNVVGMYRGIRFADTHLENGGAIVNLGSILSFTADPVLGAYSVSKGAVLQLTRVAALAFAPRDIRVNAVCPGAVRTPLTTRVWDLAPDPEKARMQMEHLYPLGRVAEPEDVADLVGFAASADNRFMTGSVLVADGGLTATNAEYGLTKDLM